MNQVQWGTDHIPLLFDRSAYPGDGDQYGYEAEIINAYEHFVEPDDCVIDVGACIGFHSCLLGKMVGDRGVVFAFEPEARSFKTLVEHVAVNNLNNVMCFRAAVWKCDTQALELYTLDNIGYSSLHRYEKAKGSETVRGIALDSILDGKQPRFIKIDCEGTEAEVLLGAQKTLERGVDCVVMEFNWVLMDQMGRSDKIMRGYMAELGYDCFLISIADERRIGHLLDPIKVEPHLDLIVKGEHRMINVMFSTEAKVRERWKSRTCSIYKS